MSGEPDDATKTICPYYGVGCGTRVLEGDEPASADDRDGSTSPTQGHSL